ncbi:MAG: DNA alkylation repair protein [Clostridia bacterium]|nr:DNA alkylation repair protein [Clostridia bacterium]
MILYREFLEELKSYADEDYKAFHKKLLKNDNINVLGVRVPVLRKLAKKYRAEVETLLTFPDEFYEITFVKLSAVALLPYEQFISYVDNCVSLMDNWATCDCFAPECIKNHKDEFLPYIYTYLNEDKEFYQRFALTTLLHYYVEEKYLETIIDAVQIADREKFYYVHMAAAWLIAEIAVKFYKDAVKFLKANSDGNFLDKKTHNKAIQKACESFRLSAEQKTYLKGLKL